MEMTFTALHARKQARRGVDEVASDIQVAATGRLSGGAFAGMVLLLTVVFAYIISVLGFMAGISLRGGVFPLGIAVAVVAANAVCRPVRADLTRGILVALGVIALSIIIATLTIDYSYDGLVYHQEIIAFLCNGWNPLRQAYPSGAGAETVSVWALHYAKGIEIAQASVVAFIGKIEAGKGVNFILTSGTAFIVFDFIRTRRSILSSGKVLLITIAAIANPVVCEQILTYYIDFYKYLYLLVLFAGMVDLDSERSERRQFGSVLIAVAVVMRVATKFNFFFEAGLCGVAAVIWAAATGRRRLMRRLLIIGSGAFALAILLAFHPYATNLMRAGHPLYPLMGEGAVDIMSGNTTEMFRGHCRFVNFFRSLLIPSLQIDVDQRNGGFTMLMPLILLLTLINAWRIRREVKGTVWYAAALCLGSCFMFEQTWWTRYICQLWFLPVLFLPVSMDSVKTRKWGSVTAWLMILAGAYASLWALKHEFVIGSYNYLLMHEAGRGRVEIVEPAGPQYLRHLDEAGADYSVVDLPLSLPADPSRKVLYFVERRPPLVIISAGQADAIRQRMEKMHLNYIRHEYDPDDHFTTVNETSGCPSSR